MSNATRCNEATTGNTSIACRPRETTNGCVTLSRVTRSSKAISIAHHIHVHTSPSTITSIQRSPKAFARKSTDCAMISIAWLRTTNQPIILNLPHSTPLPLIHCVNSTSRNYDRTKCSFRSSPTRINPVRRRSRSAAGINEHRRPFDTITRWTAVRTVRSARIVACSKNGWPTRSTRVSPISASRRFDKCPFCRDTHTQHSKALMVPYRRSTCSVNVTISRLRANKRSWKWRFSSLASVHI